MDTAECTHALLASLLTSAMDGIIVIDQNHRIALFNAAAEAIFRCPARDAIGLPLNKFVPARYREAHERHVVHYTKNGATTRSMHAPGIVAGLRADGEEFPLEATLTRGTMNGNEYCAVILRDITERLKTEALAQALAKEQAEAAVRLYRHELFLAAGIQQRLMSSELPQVPFATVRGRSLPCEEIGGDFFDVLDTPSGLVVTISDVCGKGITAALMAATIQGMVNAQLSSRVPLAEIAAGINRFLCRKGLRENYATMIIVNLQPGGRFEYVNCGHVPPLLVRGGQTEWLNGGNLPLGLFADVVYEPGYCDLERGDTLLLVTDGITEAASENGECFSDQGVHRNLPSQEDRFAYFLTAFDQFRGRAPLTDDCTVVEVKYRGEAVCANFLAAAV